MFKKVLLIIAITVSTSQLYSNETEDAILEAQQSEKVLLDKIYDYQDYANDLWNSLITSDGMVIDSETITTLNKAEESLNIAIKIGDLLFELQDKIIEYYTVYDKNEVNLQTAWNNQAICKNVIEDIESFKVLILETKSKI